MLNFCVFYLVQRTEYKFNVCVFKENFLIEPKELENILTILSNGLKHLKLKRKFLPYENEQNFWMESELMYKEKKSFNENF